MEKKERIKKVKVAFTRTVKEVEKRCPVCGNTFWGAKISRYCGRACQNKANYERHAEEYRQMRREHYRQQKA